MSDSFKHVGNSILRRTLEAPTRQVKTEELRQALTMTVESLGYDVIGDTVSSSVLLARTVAAREAMEALHKHQRVRCHSALKRFWLV
jgi:hypothetical protein